jgi:hypothetical protein
MSARLLPSATSSLDEGWPFAFFRVQIGGKAKGKRPLGKPRHRWVDNIRMDHGGVGWGDVDWIGLA